MRRRHHSSGQFNRGKGHEARDRTSIRIRAHWMRFRCDVSSSLYFINLSVMLEINHIHLKHVDKQVPLLCGHDCSLLRYEHPLNRT